MDINIFSEFIQANPLVYFIAGILLGYCLRAYKSSGFTSKKTSRYQTKPKRSVSMAEVDEPPFDWAVAAATVKTVTSPRLAHVSLEQQKNEV